MEALSAARVSWRRATRGSGVSKCQSRFARHHYQPRRVGFEQQLLARNVHEHADRGRTSRGAVPGYGQPEVFGNVSAFDPQLFASSNECAEALASGTNLTKYTPLDVAQWLEDMSVAASENQARALAQAANKNAPNCAG